MDRLERGTRLQKVCSKHKIFVPRAPESCGTVAARTQQRRRANSSHSGGVSSSMGAKGCGSADVELDAGAATRTPPMHATLPGGAAAGAPAMGGRTGLAPHDDEPEAGAQGAGTGSFAAMVDGISGRPMRPPPRPSCASSRPGRRRGGTGEEGLLRPLGASP
jgi:hypothetical protein